jgi:hypothetical protein
MLRHLPGGQFRVCHNRNQGSIGSPLSAGSNNSSRNPGSHRNLLYLVPFCLPNLILLPLYYLNFIIHQ